jgi:hypothetical protein
MKKGYTLDDLVAEQQKVVDRRDKEKDFIGDLLGEFTGFVMAEMDDYKHDAYGDHMDFIEETFKLWINKEQS